MPNNPRYSNLSTIGTDRTLMIFATECMLESYSLKIVENETLLITGGPTLTENVADLLGILITVEVYRKFLKPLDFLPPAFPFTHEQLFFATLGRHFSMCSRSTGYQRLFTQLAGAHSEGWVRLETLLKNIPQFPDAFSCSNNAAMNSFVKCAALFGYFSN